MVVSREHEAFASPSAGNRKATRHRAAALSGLVGVLFLVLPLLMTDMAPVPGATTSSPFWAFVFVAVLYFVGAGLLVAVDRPAVWVLGAASQVFVFGASDLYVVGWFGPGDVLVGLSAQLWAAGITVAQVILLRLLYSLVARGLLVTALVPAAATTLAFVPEFFSRPSFGMFIWLGLGMIVSPVAAHMISRRRPVATDLGRALLVGLPQVPLFVALMMFDVWLDIRNGYLLAGSGDVGMAVGLGTMVGLVAGVVLAGLVAVSTWLGASRR